MTPVLFPDESAGVTSFHWVPPLVVRNTRPDTISGGHGSHRAVTAHPICASIIWMESKGEKLSLLCNAEVGREDSPNIKVTMAIASAPRIPVTPRGDKTRKPGSKNRRAVFSGSKPSSTDYAPNKVTLRVWRPNVRCEEIPWLAFTVLPSELLFGVDSSAARDREGQLSSHRYLVPKMTLTGQGRLTQLSHSTTG